MPPLNEVLHTLAAAADIVEQDGVCIHPGDGPVQADYGQAGLDGAPEVGHVVAGCARQKDPICAVGPESRHHAPFPDKLLIGVCGDQKIAPLKGHIFRAANDLRKEWVGDIRHDDAQHPRLLHFQAAGNLVGVIVKFPDSCLYALSYFRCHPLGTANYIRYRRDRHAGAFGYFHNGGHDACLPAFSWKRALKHHNGAVQKNLVTGSITYPCERLFLPFIVSSFQGPSETILHYLLAGNQGEGSESSVPAVKPLRYKVVAALCALWWGRSSALMALHALANLFCYRKRRAAYVAVAGLSIGLSAAAANLSLAEYQKQAWQVEDGLPQSELRDIAQIPGGRLLIATYGGVATFDGLHFSPIRVDGRDPAASEAVNSLLVSRSGDLWIGTDDRGLIRQTAGDAVNVSEQAGFYRERIRGLFEDAAGVIWVATNEGIQKITVHGSGQSIESLDQLGPVSGDITTPFAQDGHGGTFVLTSNGVFHITATGTHSHVLQQHQFHHRNKGDAVDIYYDAHGVLWVGLRDGLVRLLPAPAGQIRGPASEFIQQPVPSFRNEVTALVSDDQGNMWVGTHNRGLCRVRGSSFTCWDSKDGLADDSVRSLFEDDEHNLWIGLSSGGLARWRTPAVIPMPDGPRDLHQAQPAAVLADHSGNLWIGTWGKGLFRMKQGRLTREVPHEESTAIRALEEDRAGNIWIGTWFSGLYRYDGVGYQHILLGRETLSDAISALLSDKQGGFWVGTYTGLLYYPDGLPAKNKGVLFLKDKRITCLTQHDDGSILVGTFDGLYVIRGGEVHRIDGLSHPYVVSISIDNARNVWVGTKGGGLDWLSKGRAVHLDTSNGMVDYPIFSVLDDGKGFLWMGTSRGIVRVQRQQLEDLAQGRRNFLDTVLLGRADGMRSSECLGVAQPHTTRTSDGSLWFTTAMGLVHTDPDAPVPPLARAPELTNAFLDDTGVDPSHGLVLSPGLQDLAFQFSSKNLGNPEQVEFRYKLDGYDHDWTKTHSRGAHYRQLPPGHYRFMVDARNAGSPWTDNITAVSVYQQPYFYQAWWFYALLCVLTIVAAVRLFRWRLTRAKGELGVVLEERNRIAREWHDTLMAGFAAIAWQMETTARLLPSESGAAKACELARNMVRHCQAEARRILWDLRDNQESTGPLSNALSNALKPLSEKEGVDMRFEVEGHEVPLAPGSVHHLVCIGQEAVTNALRHAVPSSIWVRLSYHPEWLSLSVKDDGRGFRAADKLAALQGHFGIPVMEERARKLGGSLRIETSASTGTEIFVHIPFQMQTQGG
jgi:ligand-binding sensor domain-containing protein/signal transduction histidine kinase